MQKTSSLSVAVLQKDFSQFTFEEHEVFHWSPRSSTVFYNKEQVKKEPGLCQLLHELSHALLNHTNYGSGVQLLKMETDAWQKAQELAQEYDITISPDQVENCLDSYRDWLYLRSACPNCKAISVETDNNTYNCFNCHQKWTVPKDQRSRHYRMKSKSAISE